MNFNTHVQDGDSPAATTSADRESGLAGRRIVITRAAHQAQQMADAMQNLGASPVFYPCIDIIPPEDTAPLDLALNAAARGEYDWLVLTSANTVEAIVGRLTALGQSLGATRVAAIGSKTAAAARERLHVDPTVVADRFVGEALVEALEAYYADANRSMHGVRILLPQSKLARSVIAESLSASGVEVTAVTAYQTVMGQGGDDLPSLLAQRKIDAITFTSSSTVRFFRDRMVHEGGDMADLEGVCLAVVGPVTAESLQDYGLSVDVMPTAFTVSALIKALEAYFLRARSPQILDQEDE